MRRFGGYALAMVVATLIDRPVYWLLRHQLNIAKADVDGADWWEFLRAFGYLPFWAFIAGTAWLHDRQVASESTRPVRPTRRAGLILLSAVISGLIAEGLKVVFARERPDMHDGWYHFRPLFSSLTDGGGLGLPSSHTAVAFGGAFATSMVIPAARPAMMVGAVGCALSRIFAHAHFTSDCVMAVIIAAVIARWLFESGQEGRRPDASLTAVRRRLG